ncbi:DUF6177 family protein [Streptomyces lichenis]|uniref:DUF6177 family protein n=1 Tax=Streptomyces lichenis TaxID=2306967 RepID=A0ABT0II18_9ACTN|nr:DUF6177 family protein [Streptomyces lichenis]MCK8680969.1 DUF6177 family protein [Streptomyces lichenis]
MTQDVIALTPELPDIGSLMAALYAGGPDLRVNRRASGAVTEVCGPDGQVLVSLETSRLLQVPGEAARLLGPDITTVTPVWWTELRATATVEAAERLAQSMAGRLTALLGGTVWPGGSRTEVVTPSATGPAAAPPGIDVLTEHAVVIMQDRPVVAATSWLIEAMRTAFGTGRELNIVTPIGVRLTFPMRELLRRTPSRWVVRSPDGGYYDGLTGVVLHWQDGRYVPVAGQDGASLIAEPFQDRPSNAMEGAQLSLSYRTVHFADERLVLGGALESAWRVLTGSPPAGWSTAEPVGIPWSPGRLTELARDRARQSASTWLAIVGEPEHPTIATMRVAHTAAGVEEHVVLTTRHLAGDVPPLDCVREVAEKLATRHGLATMVAELRAGSTDLTTPAYRESPPVPLSVTLGASAVAGLGLNRARHILPDVSPTLFGPASSPALHFPLSDGAPAEAWWRLQRLGRHLRSRGLATGEPTDTL